MLCANTSFAGLDQFKDLIWKDCALAREEVAKIGPEERVAAVAFLKGIIELDLSSTENPSLVNPALNRGPDGVLSDVSFAQSLDRERPIRAKLCSADLLPMLLPQATESLSSLVRQSSDERLNSDLRAAFARSAFHMAQQAATQVPTSQESAQLEGTQFVDIFELFKSSRAALAEEILVLFPLQSIRAIKNDLFSTACSQDCPFTDTLLSLLGRLDTKIPAVNSTALSMLQEASQALFLKLLRTLQYSEALYEPLLSLLLDRLPQIDGAERRQLFANLSTIFDYELRSASLAVNPKKRFSALLISENSDPSERDTLEKGLSVIAPFYSGFATSIEPMVKSKDEDIRVRAARLLSRVRNVDTKVRALRAQLLADESLYVRQVALATSLVWEENSAFLKSAAAQYAWIAKRKQAKLLSPDEAFDANLVLLRTVAQSAAPMVSKDWREIALATIAEGLALNRKESELTPALAILSNGTMLSLRDLRPFIISREPSARLAAIYVLQSGSVKDLVVSDTLLSLLSDTDASVARRAQLALLTLPVDLKETLSRKLRGSPSPYLDELLLEAGLREEVKPEITQHVSSSSCDEVSDFLGPCLTRSALGPYCSIVLNQMPRCMDRGVLESLPAGAIERAIRAQTQVAEIFKRAFQESENNRRSQIEIGMYLLRATAEVGTIDKLCSLAEMMSAGTLNEIVSAAAENAPVLARCLDTLKQKFEDESLREEQRALLLNKVLESDRQRVDIRSLLQRAIERRHVTLLKELSHGVLVTEIVPLLGPVLGASDTHGEDSKRVVALELVEDLGDKAAIHFALLPPLLKSQSNEVRYQAARAIIAVGVDPAISRQALRDILNSPKFRDLLLNTRLNNLSSTADSLNNASDANLTSYERRNLLRLLKVIRGPSAVIAESLEDLAKVGETVPTESTPAPISQ